MTHDSLNSKSIVHSFWVALRRLGWLRSAFTGMFVVLALLIALYSWKLPLSIDAEHALYDIRMVLTAEKVDQDNRIIMIAYTDDTLRTTGKRSPVDRTVLAKTLKRIDGMGAKAIGIDILIDQPQPEDPVLIEAFQAMKTPTFLAHASASGAEEKMLLWQQEFLEAFLAQTPPGNVKPTSIVIHTDDDNVLRRWAELNPTAPARIPNAMMPQSTAFADYQGQLLYRLPIDRERPVFAAIPIDSFAEDALFASPEASALFAEQVKGRYVLIGGNIEDIDIFETPLTRVTRKPTWGMELFAHMLAQQLDDKRPAPLSAPLQMLIAILVVLAAWATAASNARPTLIAMTLLLQIAALIGIPMLLQLEGVDTYGLPAFGWVTGWFITFAAIGTAARAIGSEQRKFAQSALGKYLPRDIAMEIMREPESLSLKGEKREIFVLFTDLEGFTKLSHALEPEMVATLLNRYLDMLSNVVLEYGGTIDKFVGDAVVAFWGAPISRPDDGERAVKAAIAMYQAGEEFRNSAPAGVPPIGRTRVGLHHGEAIVGNFGGEGRIQYTALGDSMNTASRLEAANKQLESTILVSKKRAMERSGLDCFRPLGQIILRGRSTPVEIYEPVPDGSAEERSRLSALSIRAMQGDVSAITALDEYSVTNADDKALANFVNRLKLQEAGGSFVLD